MIFMVNGPDIILLELEYSIKQVNIMAADVLVSCISMISVAMVLTHLPLVLHACVSESTQHWFRQWLVTYSAPSNYLNQCWVIVNWNKLQ